MKAIRFGTEGWRAVLADQYTFDNVRVVARAAANWFKQQSPRAPVAIGHDTRFLGDRFAATVADELAAAGVETRLCAGPLPTPASSYYVVKEQLAGAVVLTASHNTAEWNGLKVKNRYGASAQEEDAKWIGAEANRLLAAGYVEPAPSVQHTRFDVKEAYLNRILSLVDRDAITRAKLTVVADMMHGVGCGFFDEALRRAGCAEVRTVRDDPDPTFEWLHPEPIGPNLEPSIPLTARADVAIGLATDGDADRFGMMNQGEYIDIQRTIAFILYNLLKNRGWRGRVVRSINVTSMVDKLCERFDCDVLETPVGFKNIAPEIIKSDDVILGVEESGGFGFRGHVPDRDGTLTALMACETVAVAGKSVASILKEVFEAIGGRLYFDRLDLTITHDQRDRLREAMPSLEPASLAGKKIARVNRLDGAKFLREDDSWLLLRLSGTEPLVRIYAEARSQDEVRALLEGGHNLVLSAAGG